MVRFTALSFLALATWFAGVSSSQAQVFIRAPFVRVYVGNGVYVRAPFVTYSSVPPGPPIIVEPPQQVEPLPVPRELPKKSAPVEKDGRKAMTLDEFAKTFTGRAGLHNVLVVNPLTKAVTPVRFSLPDGMPRRVLVDPQGVEFVYGLRHFVRIHFNSDGVVVTSR